MKTEVEVFFDQTIFFQFISERENVEKNYLLRKKYSYIFGKKRSK
jgi:hypothetical protein